MESILEISKVIKENYHLAIYNLNDNNFNNLSVLDYSACNSIINKKFSSILWKSSF